MCFNPIWLVPFQDEVIWTQKDTEQDRVKTGKDRDPQKNTTLILDF